VIRRLETQPFSDKQIELLKTFADQAVIAIENVRLFTELQEKNHALTEAHAQVTEALEQQTATSEILRVISSSPTDVQPVLDAVAENAARLCGADDAVIQRVNGGRLTVVAHFGVMPTPPEHASMPITREMAVGSAVLDRRTLHVHDMAEELRRGNYPASRPFVERLNYRTMLYVPLVQEDVAVGVIVMRRAEVQPFTDQQIDLVKTFADQAVIAIENVRLFTELQEKNRALTEAHAQVTETLEQQTATSEILRVIASSPTDVQPVFDTIVHNAVVLCGAFYGIIWLYARDQVDVAGVHNIPPGELEELRRQFPRPIAGASMHTFLRSGNVLDVPDIERDDNLPIPPDARVRWLARGVRSVVVVPMRRQADVVGAIGVSHRDVGAFSANRIDLLKTFADQAVIAIENVRLFTETKEALERQTATSDILRVISSSPTDVQPVFEAIAANAARLCDATFSTVVRFDGELLHLAAMNNMTPEETEAYHRLFPRQPGHHFIFGRAFLDRRPVHVDDVLTDPDYDPRTLEVLQRAAVYRTCLGVPILRDGVSIGVIGCARREVKPFAATQIELVKTFADQAVIAIENVRLFTELETKNRDLTETLSQQTATAEILGAIARSPTDIQSVLATVAESAGRLCEASDTQVYRLDGDALRLVAHYGAIPTGPVGEFTVPVIPGVVSGRTVLERRIVHVADLQTEQDMFLQGSQLARRFGYRASLSVPLMREGVPLGAFHRCSL
jgi:GAF domain-containing protein